MPRYAMMTGNVVENIIVADDKEGTEKALNCTLVEITLERPASPGMIYDPENQTFVGVPFIEEQVVEEVQETLTEE